MKKSFWVIFVPSNPPQGQVTTSEATVRHIKAVAEDHRRRGHPYRWPWAEARGPYQSKEEAEEVLDQLMKPSRFWWWEEEE